MRKDYTSPSTVSTGGLDEPDQKFYENYVCGAERNYTGYCDPETDKLIDAQSMEADPEKRQAAGVGRSSAGWPRMRRGRCCSIRASRTCWQPSVKGLTTMTNSRFNGWRMEDVWLDK